MDFSKIGKPSTKKTSNDPLKIFERRPSLPDTPNDLWRGQSEALKKWHLERDKTDVLISLNTGSGKTLVGLLIAQSLVNEGVENVVYACSTIDLIRQTLKEAKKIGLSPTARAKGSFSDSNFESGKSFCVTTYNSVFNSLSPFRKKFFPGAIVFDDAHVAEKVLRDCFTMKVSKRDYPELFQDISSVIEDIAAEERRSARFSDIKSERYNDLYFCHPSEILRHSEQLKEKIKKHDLKNTSLFFSYIYLIEHIEKCMVIMSGDLIEISPPFIPIFSLPFFADNTVRRIYLSATLDHKADFVRAFGREPKLEIEPENDAGNGERLVLFSDDSMDATSVLSAVQILSKNQKTIISVSSYMRASIWSELANPPERDEFSKELDEFRSSQNKAGCFLLVSRVDGIDLPEDTCRAMVIDGLPTGFTLAERYQHEFLRMNNFLAAKLANRVTQLFGRINRGRNDYGVFIVVSSDAKAWLKNNRNVFLLPPLLKKQLLLGHHLFDNGLSFGIEPNVQETINKVIDRDHDWIEFYRDSIENLDEEDFEIHRFYEQENQITKAAIAGVRFQSAIWRNEVDEAADFLIDCMDEITIADGRLGGWHALWAGLGLELNGRPEDAAAWYRKAVQRLTNELPTPPLARLSKDTISSDSQASSFENKLIPMINLQTEEVFRKNIKKFERKLDELESGTAQEQEEAARVIGEEIGYESTRPDNEFNIGPDVLWLDHSSKCALAFELKTKKNQPANYTKKDIGQGHNHIEWVEEQYPGYTIYGLIFVGPNGNCEHSASPSKLMYQAELSTLKSIASELIALIQDARKERGTNRGTRISSVWRSGSWELKALQIRIGSNLMRDLLS